MPTVKLLFFIINIVINIVRIPWSLWPILLRFVIINNRVLSACSQSFWILIDYKLTWQRRNYKLWKEKKKKKNLTKQAVVVVLVSKPLYIRIVKYRLINWDHFHLKLFPRLRSVRISKARIQLWFLYSFIKTKNLYFKWFLSVLEYRSH